MEPTKKPPKDTRDAPWYGENLRLIFSGDWKANYGGNHRLIFSSRGLFSYRALLTIIAASFVVLNLQLAVFASDGEDRSSEALVIALRGVADEIEGVSASVGSVAFEVDAARQELTWIRKTCN